MTATIPTIRNPPDTENWAPPAEWFHDVPEWVDTTWESGLIQIQEGRVAALVAPYKECILDGKANCWMAPQSPTGYEFAHVGAVESAEGDIVRVANVGGGVGHFDPSRPTAMSPAMEHYANTASRVMVGRYHDRPDLGGIIFLGAMWPGTGKSEETLARCSALSGDWRWVDSLRSWDFAGSQLVNNPGFRPNRAKAAARKFAVVASLGPSDNEVLRGHWVAPNTSPVDEIAARLSVLEAMVVALVVDRIADDEPIDEADLIECERLTPWYDDHGRMVDLMMSPTEAHVAGVRKKGRKKRSRRPNPASTPKEIVGSHGHKSHGPSIKWPAMYEHLRAKGMTKGKAAAISNAAWNKKRGLHHRNAKSTRVTSKVAAMLPADATINGEPPSGANIALVPDDPAAIAVPGGDPAEALHATVKYLGGDADAWDPKERAKVERIVGDWAAAAHPYTAPVATTGHLGDEGALVHHLDAPDLVDARGALSDAIDAGTTPDTTDRYPSFRPHVTVGYNLDEAPAPDPVSFSRVRVQWGPEYRDFPLGGR